MTINQLPHEFSAQPVRIGFPTVQSSRKLDQVSSTLAYVGEASPGVGESEPKWRIGRLVTDTNGSVELLWAEGHGGFVHAWTDRANLPYY